jgi:hypothetical protein
MLVDITGRTFGRLYVVDRAGTDSHGRTLWRCVCSCGTHKIAASTRLRNGHTRSCGCMQREVLERNHITIHGESAGAKRKALSGEYRAWSQAIVRCVCLATL